MNRLANTFQRLKQRNERAFMPFLTCGDPDLEATKSLLLAYAAAGADIIELGIPFTDPLADGPTIQRANERALANGTTMDDALRLIAEVRAETDVPLVPMTYINPVFQMGYDRFAARCREAGADAVIISDLPPEEGAEWITASKAHGLDTIFFIAPTSDDARVETVVRSTTGFIYAVARMGVTGARSDVPPEIGSLVDKLRSYTDIPVCAGFGFSSPGQIRSTCENTCVDGIIVGAALVDTLEKTLGNNEDKIRAAANLARDLKGATLP